MTTTPRAADEARELEPIEPTAVRGQEIPALTGLRGIAIALVLVYHTNFDRLPGGFLGVDLFFVLSGFLITTLLIEERNAKGRLGLRDFWLRRAKRLLPALIALLIALTIFIDIHAWISGASSNPTWNPFYFRPSALSTLFFSANWHAIWTTDHSEVFSLHQPLAHTWSLAIEEQFYLVWPFIVVAIFTLGRRFWRRTGLAITLLLAACSAGAMTWAAVSYRSLTYDYNSTVTRAFVIMVGALLAFAVANRPQPTARMRPLLLVVGIIGVIGIIPFAHSAGNVGDLAFPSKWMFLWGFVVFSLLAVAIIADVRQVNPSPLGRMMSIAPLVFLGEISYALYLIHVPILFMVEGYFHLLGWKLFVSVATLSIGLAWLSQIFLERPARRSRFVFRHPWYVVGGMLMTAGIILLGTSTLIVSPSGLPGPPTSKPTPELSGALPGQGGMVGSLAPFFATHSPRSITMRLVGATMTQQIAAPMVAGLKTLPFGYQVRTAMDSAVPTLPARLDRQRAGAEDARIVISSCEKSDLEALAARGADAERWFEQSLASAVGALERRDPSSAVAILSCPLPAPSHRSLTAAQQAFNAAAAAVAGQTGQTGQTGRTIYLPVGDAVLLVGNYSATLPPPSTPQASLASGSWVLSRMSDGIHLCQPGALRIAAATLADLDSESHVGAPRGHWWTGSWRSDQSFTAPGSCPARSSY